jgi:hypothetical protein
VQQRNPAFVPASNHQLVWETVVDVVDDYFEIEREDPVRVEGGVATEGRLDTFPVDPPTVFEPWRPDSGSAFNKWEDTLQSTRCRAVVRVRPDRGGYWVNVVVYKELENLGRPALASAGAATFRNDTSLTRVVDPSSDAEAQLGWVGLGRDTALEQRIVAEIQARVSGFR